MPRGPVVGNEKDLSGLLERVKEQAKRRGAFMLKVEPDWVGTAERDGTLRGIGARQTDETIQPPATIHIDLRADEQAILARMKSKWRYNIRLAEKKGVCVREGSSEDFGTVMD